MRSSTHNPSHARRRHAPVVVLFCSFFVAFQLATISMAQGNKQHAPEKEDKRREIYVPYKDLDILLDGGNQRVFLSRDQYEDLLEKAAEKSPDTPPRRALVVSADYHANLSEGRANITANLVVEVLDEGLVGVRLPLHGVGLRIAAINDRSAPIGRPDENTVEVFLEGKGRHRLIMQLVAPLKTTAAQQTLAIRLPTPPITKMQVVVPGNVEVKSGAAVAKRQVDDGAGVTRLSVLPPIDQEMQLVMSLNNRLLQQQRLIAARSIVVDEVTASYERLHVRVGIDIVHGVSDEFRFQLPDGFEVTQVASPQLAHWAVEAGEDNNVLTTRLRGSADESVTLDIVAIRAEPPSDAWQMPSMPLLDVASQVAVVGMLVDNQLIAENLKTQGLIPISNTYFQQNAEESKTRLPASVFAEDPGAPPVRVHAAFYAPNKTFSLASTIREPAPELQVHGNSVLVISDTKHEIGADLLLQCVGEKRADVEMNVPPDWHIKRISAEDDKSLPFERFEDENDATRIRVRLPRALSPAQPMRLYLSAESTPTDWLGDWQSITTTFPQFFVRGADQQSGAVAVSAVGDMKVRPGDNVTLVPIDDAEKTNFALADVPTDFAYRFETEDFDLPLVVERKVPWITARTDSFHHIGPDLLSFYGEVSFDIKRARAPSVSFRLPKETPEAVSIRTRVGPRVKESRSRIEGDARIWTVQLAEKRQGPLSLAVQFQQRRDWQQDAAKSLPLLEATGAEYQSGFFAIEGDSELEIEASTTARDVDIGELASAGYQPGQLGRRLLGAYGFVGPVPKVSIEVTRHDAHPLPTAIVERAELVTLLAKSGQSRTVARYHLRTKAAFLEVQLPDHAQLWSIVLDGEAATPNRDGDRLLVSLPAEGDKVRDVQVLYGLKVGGIGLIGANGFAAPTLALKANEDTESVATPVAHLIWQLQLPSGYRVTRTGGTVTPDMDDHVTRRMFKPRLTPVAYAAAGAAAIAGGVNPFYGGLEYSRNAVMKMDQKKTEKKDAKSEDKKEDAKTDFDSKPYGSDDEDSQSWEHEKYDRSPVLPPLEEPTAEPRTEDVPADPVPEDEGPDPDAAEAPTEDFDPRDEESVTVEFEAGDSPAGKPGHKEQPIGSTLPKLWALEGIGSLGFDYQQLVDDANRDQTVTFTSLGIEPELSVTLADQRRIFTLAWLAGLLTFITGVCLTKRPARQKARYIITIAATALVLPVVTSWDRELGEVFDAVFVAVCVLVVYYPLATLFAWCWRNAVSCAAKCCKAIPPTTAVALIVLAALPQVGVAQPPEEQPSIAVQVVPAPGPVKIPEDAVLIPYDPDAEGDPREQANQKVLVPYSQYEQLWNRAYPDQKLTQPQPPVPYAVAGSKFATKLMGDEYLELKGDIEIDVFTDQPVTATLPVAQAVLAKAVLDGKPARLSVAAGEKDGANRLQLHLQGKGRKHMALTVRLPLTRSGGWRTVQGRLPVGPSGALTLTVPQKNTEVRLAGVSDRNRFETTRDNETIETAVLNSSPLSIRWRPQVTEGEVDRSLTVNSEGVLDICEDALRLTWRLKLSFHRSQRESFAILPPSGYRVEDVTGDNIRTWQVIDGDPPQLEVTLLVAAREEETITVRLAKPGAIKRGEETKLTAPMVRVQDAALERGQIVLRRSPHLHVLAEPSTGVARTATNEELVKSLLRSDKRTRQNPLGITVHQAFTFGGESPRLAISVSDIVDPPTVDTETVLKVSELDSTLESHLKIRPNRQPVFHLRIAAPNDLDIEEVFAPQPASWSKWRDGDQQKIDIYLAQGQTEPFSISVNAAWNASALSGTLDLPRLTVVGAARQQGDIAVQADPKYDIQPTNLTNCEPILLDRVFVWLQENQRAAARAAVRYRQADHAGQVKLSARKPRVDVTTVSNVKVTKQSLEETVKLELSIEDAGIRQLSFLLPKRMADARIRAPLLQQKKITPADDQQIRVTLIFQDELLGEMSILIETDRQLLPDTEYAVPIPAVETGSVRQRFVAFESAGRDEVIDSPKGLNRLQPQQQAYRRLAQLLPGRITKAYAVNEDTADPRLTFTTKLRKAVQTSGARIGFAETKMLLDKNGAYRAKVELKVDNRTEPHLEVELPSGAELWTVLVAKQPVKPTVSPGDSTGRLVRVPLIKTAPGDSDYPVALVYGGNIGAVSSLQTLEFPLLKTVNINIEQSQVRLKLPKGYHWFDFRGTMRLASEDDLAAAYTSYLTKKTELFSQQLETGSSFTRKRVRGNLKSLKTESNLQQRGFASSNNQELQENFASNANALKLLESQIESQSKEREYDAPDNRYELNKQFDEQRITRGRNVVKDLGGNFGVNRLVTPQQLANDSASTGTGNPQRGAQPSGRVTWGNLPRTTNSGTNIVDGRLGVGSGPADNGIVILSDGSRSMLNADVDPELWRQLARKRGRGEDQGQGDGQGESGGEQEGESLVPNFVGGTTPSFHRPVTGKSAGETGLTQAPTTGLASLQFDFDALFDQGGKEYLLVTPGGKLEVTARPVSSQLVRRLLTLLSIVIGLILVSAVYRLGRRFGRSLLTHPIGIAMLLFCGFAMMVGGIFPLLGLVAFVSGWVIIMRK